MPRSVTAALLTLAFFVLGKRVTLYGVRIFGNRFSKELAFWQDQLATMSSQVWLNEPIRATVVSTWPAENTHSIEADTNIGVTFDMPLDGSSVTDQSFVTYALQSGRLSSSTGDISSLSTSGSTITLDPANNFHPGELVQVTATGSILDNPQTGVNPYVFQFRAAVTEGRRASPACPGSAAGSTSCVMPWPTCRVKR